MLDYFLGPSKILPDDLFPQFNLSAEMFGKSICLALFPPTFHPAGSLMTGTSAARAIPGYQEDEVTAHRVLAAY